ncbi:MAG: hypothetical protein GY755_16940 [Chloroflexi bacterium]|nr:hypothetical protein [Chloroflexota bacterium]
MKILSLGWGVQSFTLAAMSALGEIEKVDYAIHADTLHESLLTYEFAEKWTSWLENHGVKVITVKNPTNGLFEILEKKKGQAFIPLFTVSRKTGKSGQLRRSCTQRWKVAPLRKKVQELRKGEQVEQWLGISTDEALRMKPSDVKYITHRWPLIDLGMSRDDCKQWLKNHGLDVAPRSSCVFCPYHSTKEWRKVKKSIDWKEALMADELVRNIREPDGYTSFIHPSRTPLESVDFRTQEEKGQLRLWDEECEGICGI